MSTRLYEYGKVKDIIRQNEWLPGRFASAWGVNLNAPAVIALNLAVEYGEILEIAQNGVASNAYTATRVDDGTASFGVLLRTTDGGINMEDGFIERPRVNTPHSIYPCNAPNYFMIAVPLVSGQTPAVGGAVYVHHTGDDAGAVRTDATTATALTGWTFASLKYQPTKSSDYVVLIQKSV